MGSLESLFPKIMAVLGLILILVQTARGAIF